MQGALLGLLHHRKEGESAMAVKVRINDREFLLSWNEFEKCFYKATTCLEILDLFEESKAANF